jgi:hypothetical protein
MGSTSASVSGTADEAVLNNIKLAAGSNLEYMGLEQAMRAAVESVIQNDRSIKAKIAAAVQAQIINPFNAAKSAGSPWPFPPK